MLTLPHTLVAAALVKLIPSPFLSLPAALLSHFILDFFVLHWNPHLYTEFNKNGRVSPRSLIFVLTDASLALGFCLLILVQFLPDWQTIGLYGTAIFLSTLPDTIEIPYYFLGCKAKWLLKYVEFEHKHQSNGSFGWGILTQIVISTLSLLIFFDIF